jgi:hypothetical protein
MVQWSPHGSRRVTSDLVPRGALVSMLTPVHTALEQQFREAVGEKT